MGKTRKGLRYRPKDEYFNRAKKEGFVARSAFKLEEMDERWKFFKAGMKILDIGCAPGSWLQYASHKVGPKGHLVGIDIDPVKINIPNVETHVISLYDVSKETDFIAPWAPFDMIQSDAMVKTVGIAESDVARSIALVQASLDLAEAGLLKVGGCFVAKVFEGPGFTDFYVVFKRKFKRNYVSKPEAVREGSREVYVVGLEYKGSAPKKEA
ncbi:MAG: RlmE family RNA methyltransferase [Bdellovibrionota bacterium]